MNLTRLRRLYLAGNRLEGPIPSSLFGLVNLQCLYLESNYLNGTVDLNILSEMKNLIELQLSNNSLSLLSSININATTLPKFKVLGLNSCNVTVFPDFLQNQDELEVLLLRQNKIHGPIPKWLWNTSKETLAYIDLSHNFLTGFDQNHPVVLPWSRLRILDLSYNMLQGFLPIPPQSTFVYAVSENELSGEIPPSFCNMSSLRLLDFSSNSVSGRIPLCLANFSSSLNALNLGSNNLYGVIPQACTSRNNLMKIDLGGNHLQGQVPTSLGSCLMLEKLDLGNNQINDTFPFWLGALPKLQVLILRSNKFHGEIRGPRTHFGFPKLRIIDISHNGFTGNFPWEYFQSWDAMKILESKHLTYMQVGIKFQVSGHLWTAYYTCSMTMVNKGMERVYEKIPDIFTAADLSSNKFEGEMAECIGKAKGLHLLNLSNNALSGQIPTSLVNLMELEVLDLSQNKLSGEIPQQLVQLTFLEFFNVSTTI
ncbi:Receptor like protein 42 [Vitis vinifera]|uniref:Receptor like protein 42 n=1 Tax=Vitis vinifera TaxID=29760 RepID=A0A438IDM3_VITVI|nr:Receptor like protein 42 [Vitis vinifera]